MHPEATRRLGHALQAIGSIQRYTANAPLQKSLSDDLTRSAVQRQLGIVQEALRVALVKEPSLRQTWPDVDALPAGCARMRDWEHEVALADLAGFVGGDLNVAGEVGGGVDVAARREIKVGSADCREPWEVEI